MNFLRSFVRLHLAGKPVDASQNVNCFLRLIQIPHSKCSFELFFFLKTHLNLPFAMKKNCQEIHKYNETSGTGIKFQCFRLRFNLVCNNTNFLIEFLKSTSLQFAVMLKTRRTLHLYRERLKGEL